MASDAVTHAQAARGIVIPAAGRFRTETSNFEVALESGSCEYERGLAVDLCNVLAAGALTRVGRLPLVLTEPVEAFRVVGAVVG